MMGSPKDEKERKDNETQHKVTLTKGFYMGVYTVTKEQWKAVMGKTPSPSKGKKNLPVETISWDDCQDFIKKLREKEKKRYRLPTEAEWEYACRAGTTTAFHFGDTISTKQATFGKFKKGFSPLATTPVGSFPANAWGLTCMAMFGNGVRMVRDYPKMWLIRKDQTAAPNMCCGAAPLPIFPTPSLGESAWFEPNGRDHTVGFRVCFFVSNQPLFQGGPPRISHQQGGAAVDAVHRRRCLAVRPPDLGPPMMVSRTVIWGNICFPANCLVCAKTCESVCVLEKEIVPLQRVCGSWNFWLFTKQSSRAA
jgi:hypothetical protein